MRVGLLVCDHVRDELRPIAGDYPDMFHALFADLDGVSLLPYDIVSGEPSPDPGECGAWIITGSRYSAYDDLPWIKDLERFVRRASESRVPLVGVCFGHQLIARAMGGRVAGSSRGWGVGSVEVRVVEAGKPDWMQPPRDAYRILNSHADQVERIPEGGLVLGWNDHCPVSLMTVGDYLLGIQGHPEMPVPYLRGLIESRRGSRMPEETADKGLRSLELGSDRELVRDWMINFLVRVG